MIQSMTGYGKAVCELPNKKISIEIKSLNSKQLDLNTRFPNLYREKEIAVRSLVGKKLSRGKIDLSFYVESATSDKITKINKQVISNYYNQLREIADNLNVGETDFLKTIMPLPDTVKIELAELDESEWKSIEVTLKEAIADIIDFRTREGQALEVDIIQRIKLIGELLKEVPNYESQRIEKIKTRIRENLEELGQSNKVDENRFEQEIIFYLEKLDVTEEKVRLSNHLEYFMETIENNDVVGKKLGFITQEIGREINTLGSKANDAELQKVVIRMKDELEKIKEQILNVL
ncbi:YicC/YloC family endoribonuclease [Carboxylicivirga sp. M1479]|uniref:YicC/YloC family endoribonuclease n=1 Tax=Carboxylicivirga sp. M1479 TaxID=2594476 RepID=UPI001178148F|nr:YicC/YloC family endoribonuclease [Carboxylicivirga sp. M1479]TRX65700.1 YicC family protein [Carboxylicivirga sp. M1479]